MGGIERPAMKPTTIRPGIGSGTSAMTTMAAVHTIMVTMSTGRMPSRPISREVSGPAMAWPMLIAASTRPAAA